MKKETLNFDFPIVKDMKSTKEKHAKRATKLRSLLIDNGLQFSNSGLTRYSLDQTITTILHSGYNNYHYSRCNEGTNKQRLRALKRVINEAMRRDIEYFIEFNELPKSYATALYCVWQKSIDKMMKAEAKSWFKEFKLS